MDFNCAFFSNVMVRRLPPHLPVEIPVYRGSGCHDIAGVFLREIFSFSSAPGDTSSNPFNNVLHGRFISCAHAAPARDAISACYLPARHNCRAMLPVIRLLRYAERLAGLPVAYHAHAVRKASPLPSSPHQVSALRAPPVASAADGYPESSENVVSGGTLMIGK